MNDDELRLLIRAAIQRHMGAEPSASAHTPLGEPRRDERPERSLSFAQYQLGRAVDDTMCLIEPSVQCNHCGYCKCHGH